MVGVTDMMGGLGGAGLGLEAIGTAGSIYAGFQEAGIEKDIASQSMQQAYDEENITKLHQQQMHLFNNRQNMENLRNVQKARSQSMAAGVTSGAQFGSGVAGAQSGEANKGGQSGRDLSQNLQVGDRIFGLTYQIDQSKIQQAQLGGQLAHWQGIGSVFGGLSGLGQGGVQAAGPLSKMFGS